MQQLAVFAFLLLFALPAASLADQQAIIATKHGDIRLELHTEQAPQTVANFKKLAEEGFYDGLTFHRVVPGFVVQGGDPDGNGSGGPGYDLAAEIDPQLSHRTGTVAMARKGDRVNPQRRSSGSQFYICLEPQPHLDGAYTIFGQVTEGMEAVRSLRAKDRIETIKVVNGDGS